MVIISVIIIVTYVQPTFDEIKSIQDETEEYKVALDNANMFAEELSALQTRADRLPDSGMSRLDVLVPDDLDEVSVMRDISEIVSNNSMSITELAAIPGGESSGVSSNNVQADEEDLSVESPIGPEVNKFQFSLGARGSYDDFKNLLSDFASNNYLLELISLSVSPSDEGIFYDYAITLETYSLNTEN